jgi:alkylation response protein AidB-like acyl-CoA dehydrogenase
VKCLAFSEPAHGSDLAAAETRADFVGNQIVVTGVKTLVAHAARAESAIVLCRTAAGEQLCVLVPLHHNHVEIRPIRTLSGDDDLYDLVFDGALGTVVRHGPPADVDRSELDPRPWLQAELEFWELVRDARRRGRSVDSRARQQLAWAYAQIRVIRVLGERDASLARLAWSEFHRRLGEIAIDIMGADGLVRPDGEWYATSRWQNVFLSSRGDTIAAGTSEMQRNTIAERVLGLPN